MLTHKLSVLRKLFYQSCEIVVKLRRRVYLSSREPHQLMTIVEQFVYERDPPHFHSDNIDAGM
jgi:hypothetical protein